MYPQRRLLVEHFLYKNTKLYLLQYSYADFLCFISCRRDVFCKKGVLNKGVLNNFLKLTGILGGIKRTLVQNELKKALFETYLGAYQTSMIIFTIILYHRQKQSVAASA